MPGTPMQAPIQVIDTSTTSEPLNSGLESSSVSASRVNASGTMALLQPSLSASAVPSGGALMTAQAVPSTPLQALREDNVAEEDTIAYATPSPISVSGTDAVDSALAAPSGATLTAAQAVLSTPVHASHEDSIANEDTIASTTPEPPLSGLEPSPGGASDTVTVDEDADQPPPTSDGSLTASAVPSGGGVVAGQVVSALQSLALSDILSAQWHYANFNFEIPTRNFTAGFRFFELPDDIQQHYYRTFMVQDAPIDLLATNAKFKAAKQQTGLEIPYPPFPRFDVRYNAGAKEQFWAGNVIRTLNVSSLKFIYGRLPQKLQQILRKNTRVLFSMVVTTVKEAESAANMIASAQKEWRVIRVMVKVEKDGAAALTGTPCDFFRDEL